MVLNIRQWKKILAVGILLVFVSKVTADTCLESADNFPSNNWDCRPCLYSVCKVSSSTEVYAGYCEFDENETNGYLIKCTDYTSPGFTSYSSDGSTTEWPPTFPVYQLTSSGQSTGVAFRHTSHSSAKSENPSRQHSSNSHPDNSHSDNSHSGNSHSRNSRKPHSDSSEGDDYHSNEIGNSHNRDHSQHFGSDDDIPDQYGNSRNRDHSQHAQSEGNRKQGSRGKSASFRETMYNGDSGDSK